MRHLRSTLSILGFFFHFAVVTAVDDDVTDALFFTSPSDVTSGLAGGVSSVTVDYRKAGETYPAPFGYGCQRFGRYVIHNLRIRSMSFDPVSDQVLLQVNGKYDSRITLARGWPCGAIPALDCSPAGGQWTTGAPAAQDSSLEFLYYEAKSVDQARIGPFAYYNRTIFFLLQRFEKHDYRTKMNVIELRRMLTVCTDGTRLRYPVTATNSAFDVLDCSALVRSVVEERYEAYHAYRPLDALVVVPSDGTAADLDFYFQLQRIGNRTRTSVDITILLTHASTRTESTEAIYEQAVDSKYLRYLLFQLGGLSHRRGRLCWAAIDRVFCGKLDEYGHLVYARNYLDVGQAADVCNAPSVSSGLRNIVTGLALASSPPSSPAASKDDPKGGPGGGGEGPQGETVLYFGCVAQVRGLGGAGLLRVPDEAEDGEGPIRSRRYITPLRRNRKAIQAGSMFVLDNCRKSVAVDPLQASRLNMPSCCCCSFFSLLGVVLVGSVVVASLMR